MCIEMCVKLKLQGYQLRNIRLIRSNIQFRFENDDLFSLKIPSNIDKFNFIFFWIFITNIYLMNCRQKVKCNACEIEITEMPVKLPCKDQHLICIKCFNALKIISSECPVCRKPIPENFTFQRDSTNEWVWLYLTEFEYSTNAVNVC